MSQTLSRLAAVIEARKLENGGDPAQSYVSRLFAKGDDAILKKIGEEATETVLAAKDGDWQVTEPVLKDPETIYPKPKKKP